MRVPDALGGGEIPPHAIALIDQVKAAATDLISEVVTLIVQSAKADEEGEHELSSALQVKAALITRQADLPVLAGGFAQMASMWAGALIAANGGDATEAFRRMDTDEFVMPGSCCSEGEK